MQRIINDPSRVTEDALEGIILSHSDLLAKTDNPRVVRYVGSPVKGRVGIVTGGGSGHEPAFVGYVGKNMVDVVAVGEIFASPSAHIFRDAIRAADGGAGVAVLYGNYAGDNMNVKMARRMVQADGIKVETVIANDDVASAAKTEREKRRGVAGEILMWKVAGAKAATGASLEEVVKTAQKAIDSTRSIGIGLSSCVIPAAGKPNFHIEPGKMEVGIGHHGEPGVKVDDLKSADEMAQISLDYILPDLPFNSGDEVVAMVSGLGATPVMELYIVYRKLLELLGNAGISIYHSYVGNYFTSLEMLGVTVTLMKLDAELKELIAAEATSIGLTQAKRS
jgi:dihydroxyacetone kinase-like protein